MKGDDTAAAARSRTISRVTLWGAAANIALTILKMAAGLTGRSAAMIADAVHSLSDLLSDIVVLVMTRIASREKDRGHDYGHGKYETLATAIIALMLLVVGGKLMAGGIGNIRKAVAGESLATPGKVAFWAAVISILVKEALFRWTACMGRKVDSPAMIANAWHHRTDALSSVASAIGIGGAILLGGRWAILDPFVCCGISIFIIVISVKMMLPALNELTDASLPDDTEKRISEIISSVSGVSDVHNLRTRRSGPDIIIDAHLVVNPEMTVAQAHSLTDAAEDLLRAEFGAGTIISLHVEPSPDSL